jgi:DNA mismatch repair protein MutS2
VGHAAQEITALVENLAEIDLAMMCAKYAEDIRASEPELLPLFPGRGNHPGSTIRLRQARHPLLNPEKVVPIDVELDQETYSVIITGPNTGGKTVTLKTVGLMVLMAQSGMHIPAQSGSAISAFCDVYADIGDEQSIEQSLSTFSGHISNIVRILRHANSESLVLFDELGAGTDPLEGAALARAIMSSLVNKSVTCLVATHYPELKTYAHATPGVVNASMEFDVTTLSPTYHLNLGLPGRSNALLIAERLGLDAEIIQDARTELDPADLRSEDLLDEIHHQRELAGQARQAAEEARDEALRQRKSLENRLEKIEDERLNVIDHARRQAETELEEVRLEIGEIRLLLNRIRQPLKPVKELLDQVELIEEKVQKPERRRKTKEGKQQPLKVGSRVRLRSLRMEGVVISLGSEDAEVQAGALRVRVRLDELLSPAEVEPAREVVKNTREIPPSEKVGIADHQSPGMEIDLRGMRAEDALVKLENYLDDAVLAGMPFVRIIHGKGTGRLREVVRQALRHTPHITGWKSGMDNEGGDGVTVARIQDN